MNALGKESTKDEILKTIYYHPEFGLSSEDKLYRRAIEVFPEIKRKDVKKFLKDQELNQVFRRVKVKKFPLSSYSPLQRCQIDLLDVGNDAGHNKNYKFIFNCVDCYTKYAFSIPIKNKSDKEVFTAFKTVVSQIESLIGVPMSRLDSDKESSFMSRQFKDFCSKNFIHQSFVENAFQVERYNRTLRTIIAKFQTVFNTRSYLDTLPKLVSNYNTSYNQSIKTTPEKALTDNSKYDEEVMKRISKANTQAKKSGYSDLKVGDFVRLKIKRQLFDKPSANSLYTKTVHKIIEFKDGEYFVTNRSSGYKNYELMKVNKVEQLLPQTEEEKEQEVEQKQEERTLRRSSRRLNKEGVSKEDIEKDAEPRQMRKYRKPRSDLGPYLSLQ